MDVSERGIIEVDEAPPPLELNSEEMAARADALVEYHAAFADLYARKEPAHGGLQDRPGLLWPIARKAIEPMALALDGGDVQAMPQFMGQGQDDAWRHQHGRLVDTTWGEADGVYIVAGSDGPTQGEPAGGVARQWGGHGGKVDHCQAGGCAASASRKGDTLLDRRRYLPEAWFDAAHHERWRTCGIPEATRGTPTPALARAMLQAVVAAGTRRVRWGTCDEACGRPPAFLDGVAAQQRWYDAAVPHDTQVWRARPTTAVPAWAGRGRRPRQARGVRGAPAPQRVEQLATVVPTDGGQPSLSKEGSKGPLVAECAPGTVGFQLLFHQGAINRAHDLSLQRLNHDLRRATVTPRQIAIAITTVRPWHEFTAPGFLQPATPRAFGTLGAFILGDHAFGCLSAA